MLGLLRRGFSSSVSVPAKRSISLVRSQVLYCSSVWHPYLLVDIKYLECVQRRATKFIASNPLFDYRNRLIHLNLLPLMMEFEIVDIMFLVKSVKFPSGHFNIHEYFWDHFMSTFNLCTYHYMCPCPKCSQLRVKMHFNVSL